VGFCHLARDFVFNLITLWLKSVVVLMMILRKLFCSKLFVTSDEVPLHTTLPKMVEGLSSCVQGHLVFVCPFLVHLAQFAQLKLLEDLH